jgi:hypothetical protein
MIEESAATTDIFNNKNKTLYQKPLFIPLFIIIRYLNVFIKILNMFYLKLCKKKAAYKAKPISKLHLDLSKIKKTYKTSFSTTKLIVIETEGLEIIVQEDGELLFKNSKDKKLMEKVAKKIYKNVKLST